METPQQLLALKKSLEAYKDVVLTPEEEQEALMIARQKKHAKIKNREYLQRLSKPVIEPKTAQDYQAEFLALGNILDDSNKDAFKKLVLYFINDPGSTLDPNKGIMLSGGIGCGKTTLMRFFEFNQKASYFTFSCLSVSSEFAAKGYEGVEKYNGAITSYSYGLKSFGQTEFGICFDDLGTEVDKKHYGNQSNCLNEILLNRYNRIESLRGKTHITTNLTADQIEERYGSRVRSRLREMFNVIDFPITSKDRRK